MNTVSQIVTVALAVLAIIWNQQEGEAHRVELTYRLAYIKLTGLGICCG